MLTELLLKTVTNYKLDSEFTAFIREKLRIEDFKIVHYQIKPGQKSLLLRFKGKREDLPGRTFRFKNSKIRLEELQRPIITTINTILDFSDRLQAQGKSRLRLPKFSKIVINKISPSIQKWEIEEKMKKFGKVEEIQILEKVEKKEGKEFKYSLANVNFESIDSAIEAFHSDRVKIRARNFKIKLYLNPYKVRAFLKRYKLKPKSGQGNTKGNPQGCSRILPDGKNFSLELTNNNSPVNHSDFRNRKTNTQGTPDLGRRGGLGSIIPECSFTSYNNLFHHLKHVQEMTRPTMSKEHFKICKEKKIKLRKDFEIENIEDIQCAGNLRLNHLGLNRSQNYACSSYWEYNPNYNFKVENCGFQY